MVAVERAPLVLPGPDADVSADAAAHPAPPERFAANLPRAPIVADTHTPMAEKPYAAIRGRLGNPEGPMMSDRSATPRGKAGRHLRRLIGVAAALALAGCSGPAATEAHQAAEARPSPSAHPSASASRSPHARAASHSPSPAGQAESTTPDDGIDWGNPVFVDRFNGTTVGPNWKVYNDPEGSTPRTVQSVSESGGSLNLIGHYQAPYGYVGGGVANVVNQTYGMWEIQFRADAGAGYEPAVLLWPEGTWPNDGEIDLAEVFPGTAQPASTNRVGFGQFLHMGADDSFLSHRQPGINFSHWQTVAVTWLPGKITYWLNGKPTWTVTAGEGGMDYIPDTPFHLALQLDENCNDRCAPNSSTPSQVVMQVNWVKVWAMPGSPSS